MTHGRTPRVRSAQGAKCEFPGCKIRASSTRKPATLTINGHVLTVERLCMEHRTQLGLSGRPRPNPRRTRPPAVTVAYYRCTGCGELHEAYSAAEHCADSHGGGRIESGLILETGSSS